VPLKADIGSVVNIVNKILSISTPPYHRHVEERGRRNTFRYITDRQTADTLPPENRKRI
jgi:hypothetical protein